MFVSGFLPWAKCAEKHLIKATGSDHSDQRWSTNSESSPTSGSHREQLCSRFVLSTCSYSCDSVLFCLWFLLFLDMFCILLHTTLHALSPCCGFIHPCWNTEQFNSCSNKTLRKYQTPVLKNVVPFTLSCFSTSFVTADSALHVMSPHECLKPVASEALLTALELCSA